MGYRISDHYTLILRSRFYDDDELMAFIEHIPLYAATVSRKIIVKESIYPESEPDPDFEWKPVQRLYLDFFSRWEDRYESVTHDAVQVLMNKGIPGVHLELIEHDPENHYGHELQGATFSCVGGNWDLADQNFWEETKFLEFERAIQEKKAKK